MLILQVSRRCATLPELIEGTRTGRLPILARGYFEEAKDLPARILYLVAMAAVFASPPWTPQIIVSRDESVEILDSAEYQARTQKKLIVLNQRVTLISEGWHGWCFNSFVVE